MRCFRLPQFWRARPGRPLSFRPGSPPLGVGCVPVRSFFMDPTKPSTSLIRSTGVMERLDSDGFPVGMFANTRYTARELQMRPGDRLVIFSDGLTDAQNTDEEEFGDERLIDCFKSIAPGIDANG